MTRETKIGLLVGLLFIVAFGLVLSGIMPKEDGPSALSPEMKKLAQGTGSPPVPTRPLTVSSEASGDHRVVGTADSASVWDASVGPVAQMNPGRVESAVVGPAQTSPVVNDTPVAVAPVVAPPVPSGNRTVTVTYDTLADVLAAESRVNNTPPAPVRQPVPAVAVVDTMLGPTPVPVVQPAVVGQKYVVKQGDTLYGIARTLYGDANASQHTKIFDVNKSVIGNPNNLKVGMELTIPPLAAPAPAPKPTVPIRATETVIVGLTPAGAASRTPPLVVVDQPTPAPAAAKEKYVVKKGDTLFAIARKSGLTTDDLAKLNGIKDANSIRVGQELMLGN
ncbi:MAG: LysM peptidoglycan-binding domain-containing protein [Phycisphaerae bacterium]|nr:LysM peptidoglycan-binding domain-containing protein [Phycisphaerae bacterium]